MRYFFLKGDKIKSERAQTLVLIIFIVIIFTATVASIASLTTRELEMEEIQERSLKVSYAVESGQERARHYLKDNIPEEQVTISCPIHNCMDNGGYYDAYITPGGKQRPNGSTCTQTFCIDVNGGIE